MYSYSEPAYFFICMCEVPKSFVVVLVVPNKNSSKHRFFDYFTLVYIMISLDNHHQASNLQKCLLSPSKCTLPYGPRVCV